MIDMQKLFRIVNITDKEGNRRLGGVHSNSLNKVVTVYHLQVGHRAMLPFEDNDKYLDTSPVESIEHLFDSFGETIIFKTRNSVYKLKENNKLALREM